MDVLILLVIVGTSIWVYMDAKAIGIKKGQVSGLADMGPGSWAAGNLLLWIVVFPLYLMKRGEFKRINQKQ